MGDDASDDYVNSEANYLPDVDITELAAALEYIPLVQLAWRGAFRSLPALAPNFSVDRLYDDWKASEVSHLAFPYLRALLVAAAHIVAPSNATADATKRALEMLRQGRPTRARQRAAMTACAQLLRLVLATSAKSSKLGVSSLQNATRTGCPGNHPNEFFDDFDLCVSTVDPRDGLSNTIYEPDYSGSEDIEDDALAARMSMPVEVTYVVEALWQSGAAWRFWSDWYDAFVDGRPIDWELQRRISLLSDGEWQKGPAHIAAKIEEIKAQYLSQKSPLAETIDLNPETGLFRTTPIPVQNPPLIGAVLSRVRDSLDDALQGNNGLNERSREVRVLVRTVDRYGNDPQRIEMDFTSVAVGLRRQIDVTQELPASEDNAALLEAVEEGVRAIRATHPDVAANREILALQSLRELSVDDHAELARAAPILAAISEGILAEDFAEDIPTLITDAFGVPETSPQLLGADARIRVFGRVSRMALLWDKTLDLGARAHDSRSLKLTRLGLTTSAVCAMLYAVVQIGLKLLGIL